MTFLTLVNIVYHVCTASDLLLRIVIYRNWIYQHFIDPINLFFYSFNLMLPSSNTH